MLKEFKEFAIKGNAVDMAVGIIIGAAFGSIISSLVKDIVMPPISLLTRRYLELRKLCHPHCEFPYRRGFHFPAGAGAQ